MDAQAAPPPKASLLQTLQGLWRELPGLVGDRVEILSLELQRAGAALAQIVALAMAMVVLGLTAWLLLWAGIVTALTALGLHLGLALGIALLLNLVGIGVALARVFQQMRLLKLPATRRHLSFRPAGRPPSPSPEPTADDHRHAPAASSQPAAS